MKHAVLCVCAAAIVSFSGFGLADGEPEASKSISLTVDDLVKLIRAANSRATDTSCASPGCPKSNSAINCTGTSACVSGCDAQGNGYAYCSGGSGFQEGSPKDDPLKELKVLKIRVRALQQMLKARPGPAQPMMCSGEESCCCILGPGGEKACMSPKDCSDSSGDCGSGC